MTMENYCGDINKYYEYLINYPNVHSCPYSDPDGTHTDGENSRFYKRLETFLNDRESNFAERIREKWSYKMIAPKKGNEKPSSIEASIDEKSIMYLRSDLFGFSAPKGIYPKGGAWDNRYPYAKYLLESTTESSMQEKCYNVANWVWATRTIGGSFIWPIRIEGYRKYPTGIRAMWNSWYNTNRGVNCYLQDRVDLTLFEVMHYYDHKRTEIGAINLEEYEHKGDILFMDLKRVASEAKGTPYMQTWLDHFNSFETYVKFFMFEDFVCENEDGKLVPKNIINGEPLTEECVQAAKSAGGVIQTLSVNDVENILKNVSRWISDRSKSIEEELSKSENGTDCNT